MGEGIEQRNRRNALFPNRWAACRSESRRIGGLADVLQDAAYRDAISYEGDDARISQPGGPPTNALKDECG